MCSALLSVIIISTVLLRSVQADHTLRPRVLGPANDPHAQRSQLLMLLFASVADAERGYWHKVNKTHANHLNGDENPHLEAM